MADTLGEELAVVRDNVELEKSRTDLTAFLEEFQRETDRATAVLGVAMLDALLEKLITQSVRNPMRVAESLLETTRPLGAFSARIDVAQAFGLIADDDAADLHVVRKIRNVFAHGLQGMHFAHDKVRDLTSNLKCVQAEFAYGQASKGGRYDSPRGRFILGVALLSAWLTRRCKEEHRPEVAMSVADYTQQYRAPSNVKKDE